MRKERAKQIAEELNKTERWHSHGTGISMEVLRRDLKMIIDDLEQAPERWAMVKQYDGLLFDYMVKLGSRGVLHTAGRYLPFM